MGHDATQSPPGDLDLESAQRLAEILQAFGTASRLMILNRLRDQPRTVGDLADSIEMDRSSVSHQLRVLRHLGLVVAYREGRTATYALYDDHVGRLVDQAMYHLAHRTT